MGGGTFDESDKPNASGNAVIGSLNTAGNVIVFKATAASAGKAIIAVRMASNASQGTAATTFSPAIFTVTVNGTEITYEGQEVAGGTTYNDVFGDVVIGEVDLVAGENTIVITVVDANNMGNIDCLKITTAVAIS